MRTYTEEAIIENFKRNLQKEALGTHKEVLKALGVEMSSPVKKCFLLGLLRGQVYDTTALIEARVPGWGEALRLMEKLAADIDAAAQADW
jgi:hypothetical protein